MADQQSQQRQQKKDLLTEKEIVDDIVSRVDEEVFVDIKKRLRDVLNRYSAVFSRGEYDLGWTDLVTHRIDMADHRPIRQQLRRYPPAHLEAIDEHFEQHADSGRHRACGKPMGVEHSSCEEERWKFEMLHRLPQSQRHYAEGCISIPTHGSMS